MGRGWVGWNYCAVETSLGDPGEISRSRYPIDYGSSRRVMAQSRVSVPRLRHRLVGTIGALLARPCRDAALAVKAQPRLTRFGLHAHVGTLCLTGLDLLDDGGAARAFDEVGAV